MLPVMTTEPISTLNFKFLTFLKLPAKSNFVLLELGAISQTEIPQKK